MTAQSASAALQIWSRVDSVLGLDLNPQAAFRMDDISNEISADPHLSGVAPSQSVKLAGEESVPEDIQRLLMDRLDARKRKDFKRSDQIRDELKAKGWAIEDSPKGPKLKRL